MPSLAKKMFRSGQMKKETPAETQKRKDSVTGFYSGGPDGVEKPALPPRSPREEVEMKAMKKKAKKAADTARLAPGKKS